ncbi:MAG: DUF167 domain-containing protein [Actinobacteria bacterium]|nr:DUF167 domain-containing protein [Actinomycetota bacterium]
MSDSSADKLTEVLKLQVKTGADKNFVEGIKDDLIKIRIACEPKKGKANKVLIKFISRKTGIPRNLIKIISGEKSAYKMVSVQKPKDYNIYDMLIKDLPAS